MNSVPYLLMLILFLVVLELVGQQAWAWCMERMSLFDLFVVGGFGFYMVLFWGLAAIYLRLTYTKRPAWLYRYKIQGNEDPDRIKVPLRKSILVVLGNQVFGTLPFLIGVYALMVARGYDASQAVPPWSIALFHVVMMVLLQDVFFFLSHRLLHVKWFFRRFHRIHHEYRESVAIATHYVHYVEHIVGNLFPVFIGAVIFLPHPFVILFWIQLIVMNALHTHGGFAIPFMSYAVHHDFHHYNVDGNYSSIGLTDRIFGTDTAFRDMERSASEGGEVA